MSNESVIGIDLGTTHSLVAVVQEGTPQILDSEKEAGLMPSVVSWEDGQLQVGFAARKNRIRNPKQTIFSVKRLLGRSAKEVRELILPYEVNEEKDNIQVKLGNQQYSPIEISAILLRALKQKAQDALGYPIHQAVVTVPAYFNDIQRQSTRMAGKLAGLDILRILNEPTAAALAYGLSQKNQGMIAVYDLGGGTFDISILRFHHGIFEVLSTAGDTALGGDDIDFQIANQMMQEIKNQWNTTSLTQTELHAQILEASEALKKSFSQHSEAIFQVQFQGKVFQKKWQKEEFETLVKKVLEKTHALCIQALKDAGLEASQLSDVILVGGPTRLPIVQHVVKEIFNRPPNVSLHPEQAVALGAAIQADILSGKNEQALLVDVVPLTLGIETYGGVMTPLIPRNTRIPFVAKEIFTTFVDGQTAVEVHVLQGEREKVECNRSLFRFKLKGIQPQPAGVPRIEVSFLIDADGILQVYAKDLHTQKEQIVEINPSFGLSEEKIYAFIEEGIKNQEKDRKDHQWIEAKNHAQAMLLNIEKQLTMLPEKKMKEIQLAIEALKSMLSQDDFDQLEKAALNLKEKWLQVAQSLKKKN